MKIKTPKKSPAIRGKWIAGFLLGSYIRNKTYCILISYILIHLFSLPLANQAYGLEASSNFYNMDLINFANGGGALSSPNNDALYTWLGEAIGGTLELSSTNFGALSGQVYMILSAEAGEPRLIGDLRALTEVLGSPILEASWQTDNDPYFYWNIITEPPEMVVGFSISLDTEPANEINNRSSYYQFAEDNIASGKHTFYVLPFTSEKAPDADSLLKFEIWVDTREPTATQLKPASGEISADNLIGISCNLSDPDSGVDPERTTLTLNGSSLYFTYDAQTSILQFTPSAPLADGKNTVLLKAYDMTGNYTVKGWDFIVDTHPPSGGIKINNGEEFTHSAYVAINIEAEEAVSGIKAVYLSNDGIFDTELSAPYPYSPLISNWLVAEPDVDAKKTVYAKFEDSAGNFSPAYKASITLRLLTPNTWIISGPPSLTEETSANFKFEASKTGCKFSYKLDNQAWSEWSESQEIGFAGLAAGNHYFYVKSGFDLNGDNKITIDEEDATPAQWAWTVKLAGEVEKGKEKVLFYRR